MSDTVTKYYEMLQADRDNEKEGPPPHPHNRYTEVELKKIVETVVGIARDFPNTSSDLLLQLAKDVHEIKKSL